MLIEKEVQSGDKTPDMFQEDFTKLMMKKQQFKLCNATRDSTGFSLGISNDSEFGEDSTQVQKFVKYVDGEELSNFLDLAEQKNSQMFESFNEPFTHRTSSQNNLSTWSIREVDCPTKQKWYFRNRSSSVGPNLGSKAGQQKRPNFGFEEIVSPTQVVPGCLEKGTATPSCRAPRRRQAPQHNRPRLEARQQVLIPVKLSFLLASPRPEHHLRPRHLQTTPVQTTLP